MSCSLGCCCCENETPEEAKRPMSSSPLKRNVCCTDVIFLIIFIVFWGGMIYIAAFSIAQGAALRLVYGYDNFGNTCNSGRNNKITNITLSGRDTTGKSNVFFTDISHPFTSVQLCVSKCPEIDLVSPQDVKKFAEDTGSRLCDYDKKVEDYASDLSDYSRYGPCPALPILASKSVLNRCVPDITGNLTTKVLQVINNDDLARKILSDLFSSWKEMLVLCFVALGLALIMVFLMRFLAQFIVWFIIILAALACIAATAFLWWTYIDIRGENEGKKRLEIFILELDITNEKAFLGMAITATILTVILLLVLLVMRSRVALVVALFHEAGKCIAKMPSILIQPVWTFLILMVFFVYWVIVLGFLSTAGDPTPYDRGFKRSLAVEYQKSAPVKAFWWYHLVGLIWTSEFILACQQMVVAGSVAMWYFTRDKSNLGCVVGKATCRVVLHHIGSLAFGSFIITLVKLPRLILMYLQQKCKGSENPCAQFLLKCCICCLWCLEKLLKFLNQNAYTIVAIEGKSFCPAAKKAFTIITSNVLRVAAINSVGDFVLFVGKIGVMAATAAIGIVWLKAFVTFTGSYTGFVIAKEKPGIHFYALPALLVGLFGFFVAHCVLSIYEHKEDLHFWAVPVILVCAFAFLIAHCFLSVYEMVIDTLLLCFCEDCQINDGTEGREYFMSPTLMKFVKNSSRAMKNLERAKAADETDGADDAEEEMKTRSKS